ncbi:MAG: hypothetical protein QMD21_07905, partial [Candidatus Thermoplasmatota archaeon]|nr:hypothetical protein [Candidatus Thermoplasmatota archaeon]
MIISMNEEVLVTGIGLTIAVITLGLTIYLTNKSTQKILDRIAHAIHGITHLTEKVASHSEVDFELGGVKIA